jgi:hypothetical protein
MGEALRARCGQECIIRDHAWFERARLEICTWDARSLWLVFDPLPAAGLLAHPRQFTIGGSWERVDIDHDSVSMYEVGTYVYFSPDLVRQVELAAAALPDGVSPAERHIRLAAVFTNAQR